MERLTIGICNDQRAGTAEAVAAEAEARTWACMYYYRVTIHIVPNLLLTSKQKFCFSMRPMHQHPTFVLVSTGGWE